MISQILASFSWSSNHSPDTYLFNRPWKATLCPKAARWFREKGTTALVRMDGHELVSLQSHPGVSATPPFPWLSKGGRCSHPTDLSCLWRACWTRTLTERGWSLVRSNNIEETHIKGWLLNYDWIVCKKSFSSGYPNPEKMDKVKLGLSSS